MNPLLKIPIRWQLLIIVALVALPAAGMMFYSQHHDRQREIEHALRDTQHLVAVVSSDQRLFVGSAQQLLITLAQLPQIDNKDAVGTDIFLKSILRLHPNLINIFVADAAGKIWASALPHQNQVTISDRRYFRNAIATGRLSSGEFQVGRIAQVPVLNFGYPYRGRDGTIIGVITVSIALHAYGNVVKEAKIPHGSNLVITDYKGIVLFSAVPHDAPVGTALNPVYFEEMREGADAGTSIIAGPSETARYLSYRKLRLDSERFPYAYVWVSIPVAAALAGANEAMAREVSVFAAVLVSALITAWFVGNRSIADRVTLLERASKAVAEGDLKIRVSQLVRGGEIGRLGESFDEMAQQLQSREETLATSQRFLSAIIDSEPECLMLLDGTGDVRMINPAGVKMLEGESTDHLKGESIYGFVDDGFRDAFQKVMDEIFQGVAGSLEIQVKGRKGAQLRLDVHAVPFRNEAGEIVSLLAIARDVTERHLAEQALLQREAELRKAQEIANVGSWTAEMSGTATWSLQMYRIFGVSPQTFIPDAASFLSRIHPEDRLAMQEWMRACVTGEEPGELQFRIVWPDGSVRHLSGRGELVTGVDGKPLHMSGTAQDVTERKHIEEALKENQEKLEELNRLLEARVTATVAELRRKDEVLMQQSRLAAMGEMIGNIAHQWRQPLNSLGLIIQELAMTYGTDLFTEKILRAQVSKSMELINHMSRTIEDLSSFFKPEARKGSFSVHGVVTRTLSLIDAGLRNRGIRLEVALLEDSEINGYEGQYAQVLLNILINARDAFDQRGVDRNRIVTIKILRERGRSLVIIGDNAGGIPEEVMEKIFDPYFTTKGPDRGTGIGLYMAKTIIEKNMNGRLSARNTAAGAEFTIEV